MGHAMPKLLAIALIVAAVGATTLGYAEDPDFELFNTGMEDHYWPAVDGQRISFIFYEPRHGDQNGDGDANDNLLGYYDTVSETWTVVPREAYSSDISGSLIAFWDPTTDWVSWYDIEADEVTETDFGYDYMRISGTTIVSEALESRFNEDTNGDGDQNDWVIAAYDTDTELVTSLDAIGSWPDIDGSIIVFETSESRAGQDLNADGDQLDTVIRYHDLSTGVTTNTGQVGQWPSISGSLVAFDAREAVRGGDYNGDGDTYDHVTYLYDLGTSTVTTIGIGWGFVGGGIVGISTRESALGSDLDGDGTVGYVSVIRYYDVATQELVNTGIVGDFWDQPSVGADLIAFTTSESSVGVDLTGDGDTSDSYVLRYVVLPPPEAMSQLEDLVDLVDAALEDEDIDCEGVAVALQAQLTQAGARLDADNAAGATRALNAFMHQVEAQSGKHITAAAAEDLVEAAEAIIDAL